MLVSKMFYLRAVSASRTTHSPLERPNAIAIISLRMMFREALTLLVATPGGSRNPV
jgi:hypothetical protein